MTKSQTRGTRFGLAMLGAGLMLSAVPAGAQLASAFQESPSQALSRHLKSLAANPQSLDPLMGAGRAALALGDAQAALTFFGRAEEIAPRDGRIKMWMGSALVQLQQPQGALKFFDQAVSLGAPEADVAGERGLAWDISGDPRRAQRDYRLALQKGANPEVTRRLALSLALSGEREPALRLLDDQLRVRDRDAERTRALILAATGDSAGAVRAVQASMPGGRGSAMAPFLERLSGLNVAERARAVHLGVFPQSGQSAGPLPNTYAAADPVAAGATDPRQAGLGRNPDPKARDTQLASREPAPAGPSARVSWSAGSRALSSARRQPEASKPASSGARSSKSVIAASSQSAPAETPRETKLAPVPARAETVKAPAPAATLPVQIAASVPAQGTPAVNPGAAAVSQPTETAAAILQPSVPSRSQTGSAEPRPIETAALAPSEAPAFSLPTATEPASESAAPADEAAGSRLADVAATVAALPDVIAEPKPAPAKPAAAKPAAAKPAPKVAAPPAKEAKTVKTAAAEKDDKAAKPGAGKAATPAKAQATAKKPAPPAEPARVWVQVAGGAQKAALPREFDRLKAKAPKLLAARSAWTTPLKATNRLLVGPFKTEKEAQEFVNELAKSKLDGFAWTSEAGQKIEKLPAK
ncbi:SPOR domain-containing protein [Sphingomonas parva]|uniref:SPOR domain-containing protein n=1 Tax=Sphingomonas parva TaxID=2555898 RepID=A0A4Y8ZPL7_9SPHN|nr:SPOR domain-containing protein [Sphingomonas parva]TFI57948.1 SPOR domain-containing protein [Sphingomonas parva]